MKAYGVLDYNNDKIVFVSLDKEECEKFLNVEGNTFEVIDLIRDNKILDVLNDSLSDAYDYLAGYANEYLPTHTFKAIQEFGAREDLNQDLGRATAHVILNLDNTAEYETGYIQGLKEAIILLTK